MATKRFAFILGLVFLLFGVASFISAFVEPPRVGDPDLAVTIGYGRLFGIYPINILHSLVFLGFGLWGLAASRDLLVSKKFCRGMAIFYGALVVLGLFPVLNTVFGLVPVFGNAIWFHLLVALPSAYFGFSVIRHNVVATPRV